MNILHVAPAGFERPHGVSVYVIELIRALLARRGTDRVALLSMSADSPISLSNKIPGCVIIDKAGMRYYDLWFSSQAWLDKIEQEFGRPDFVHFHEVYSLFQSVLARQCVRRGWKYIVSMHGGFQAAAQKRSFFKKKAGDVLFNNVFVRNASAIHVLNDAEAHAVHQKFPGVRTIMVPNGVSFDTVRLFKEYCSGGDKSEKVCLLKVGFIGRIDIQHKGIDLLFQAIKLLEQKCENVDFRFVFVGPFHKSEDKHLFKQLCSSLKYPERIIMTGPLVDRDKWEKLSNFDVFIHTSRFEGMPGAVIEAMAFRKPCILTPGTNMQEIIVEHQAGWGCQAIPQSIMDVLCLVANDRSEILRRGINAQEYVVKNLTWDKVSERYLDQIRGLKN